MKIKSKKIIGVLSAFIVGVLALPILVPMIKNDNITSEETKTLITFKQLSETQNDDGTFEKIISYSIEPNNVSSKEMKLSILYENGTACQDVLTGELDYINQTITLTCLKPFKEKILVKITSIMNKNISAILEVDYLQKILKADYANLDKWGPGTNSNLNNFSTLLNVEYSDCTKKVNYSFTVEEVEIEYRDKLNCPYAPSANLDMCVVDNPFIVLLEDCFKEFNELPTAEDIWNCNSEFNWWQQYLYDTNEKNEYYSIEDGMIFMVTAKIVCNEDPSIEIYLDQERIIFVFGDYDFSEFYIEPEIIEFEKTSLEF